MTLNIPWAWVEAVAGIAACAVVGALLGVGAVLVRVGRERRG